MAADETPVQGASRRRAAWLTAVLALAAALTWVVQEHVLTVFQVQGCSMEPTLREGQRVLVLRHPSRVLRGDLLVFRNPYAADEVLIKRVLALPGERILVKDGRLYVNDLLHPEPYVKAGTTILSLAEERLPEGTYYLLGDNRAESIDSRKLGPIERDLLIGKVVHRF
ncbi:MAG: signal peptidase I [Planctomycetota bacterium]